MSTIDSGHLEVGYGGQEGAEEVVLVGRREDFDLRTDARAGRFSCTGGAALCDERQSDPQVAARSSVCAGSGDFRDGERGVSAD